MGISGLLPLLKSIQVRRDLSEYSGQTIAVDAYGWLHRGTYACATELATGKKTTKYVDFAMHRVRLLRHHNITPYIVFDGGPLPAKKLTESDRKKRREENLTRANSLAAQGKHSQAREFYVKCIDVTPQMAYQFIKALKAESVPYVVAPYEADAQMAYLERVGLVNGVLTEDSDLLVFGCKNVLLKLDTVDSTIISVTRSDFASLGSSSGISLLGWSDAQFRSMAILSGCDYLPSIPGIGLKTAWSLLKKHKTVENVIRALRMEGKKDVPKGYLEAFRLAESVFLHQRVYDPAQEMLVNLTEVPHGEEWNDEKETHVGGYIEPSLAKKVAQGDACPITLLPMEDINPTFIPRTLKAIPMNTMGVSKLPGKAKGHTKALSSGGKSQSNIITNFFTSTPDVRSRDFPRSAPVHGTPARIIAGRASGKRTLAEVMDQDVATKRKRRAGSPDETAGRRASTGTSRFFGQTSSAPPTRTQSIDDIEVEEVAPTPASSRSLSEGWEKENVLSVDEDDDVAGFSEGEDPDPVLQEDGYLSPTKSLARGDTPEISSPVRPGPSSTQPGGDTEDDNFGADVLSSPPAYTTRRHTLPGRWLPRAEVRHHRNDLGPSRVLVSCTPPRLPTDQVRQVTKTAGPDLRDVFEDWNELTSEIDECCDDSLESAVSSGGPITPEDSREFEAENVADTKDDIVPDDDEVIELHCVAARNERVANGWWEKYARAGKTRLGGGFPKRDVPRRRETTITAEGRQKPEPPRARHHDLPSTAARRAPPMNEDLGPVESRTNVAFLQARKRSSCASREDIARAESASSDSDGIEEIIPSVKTRFAEFSYRGT